MIEFMIGKYNLSKLQFFCFKKNLATKVLAKQFKTQLKIFFLSLNFLICNQVFAWQGLSVYGDLKYSNGFSQLSYVNAHAPKGGRLVLAWSGDFDTLNAFSAKGISPLLLENLVFQSLGQSTLDEPFSQYPELAKTFVLSDDQLSMTVKLKKDAKFSDGSPVSAKDVLFSFNLFRSDHVNAFYKSYWADIKSIKIIDDYTVKFLFAKKNKELPAIATQLTILPSHFYDLKKFGNGFHDQALGSGPYVVDSFKRGSIIKYKRNINFWGKDDPFYKGRYNFDEIIIKYYRDETAKVEAFKKGEFDMYVCYSSKIWANDMKGKKFNKLKWIKKEHWLHKNNQGGQGFFFNLRREIFQDIRVRKALALAFDFNWTNKTLFYKQYKKNKSFFGNSPFEAKKLPLKKELRLLQELSKKFPKEVPDSVFENKMGYLGGSLRIKQRLKLALKLLKEAGYSIKDGVMTSDTNKKLSFNFLLSSQMMARVIEPYIKNLKRIGVIVKMEIEESSVYQRKLHKRNFDMIVLSVGQSQSPGNEQKDFWHSSQADAKYARNHYGLKNKAVDSLVEKIIYSQNREELVLHTKALDRLLYHLHFAVQNWHSESHRVAIWQKFGKPEKKPLYYSPLQLLDSMWFDSKKANKLKVSISTNKAM